MKAIYNAIYLARQWPISYMIRRPKEKKTLKSRFHFLIGPEVWSCSQGLTPFLIGLEALLILRGICWNSYRRKMREGTTDSYSVPLPVQMGFFSRFLSPHMGCSEGTCGYTRLVWRESMCMRRDMKKKYKKCIWRGFSAKRPFHL